MPDIFDVIADSTRRDILELLRERETAQSGSTDPGVAKTEFWGEVTVSELVATLNVNQPTVSKHLRVLRDANLVRVREDGQRRFYRLVLAPLEELEDWLIPFLSPNVAADAAVLARAEALNEALNEEQRALAAKIGRVFASTAHQVTSVVKKRSSV